MDGRTRTSCRRSSPCSRVGVAGRARQRPDHHQAARQRLHRHARHGADHQGLHRRPLRRPGRARSATGFESLGYTRFGIDPGVGVPARGGRRRRLVPAALRRASAIRLYAVGGDEEVSAPLRRAHAPRRSSRAHVLCSVCAAVTGLFLASRLGAGTPTVGTDGGYDLESIAAVVLGGTALAGRPRRRAGHDRRRASSSPCSTTCSTSSRSTRSSRTSCAA